MARRNNRRRGQESTRGDNSVTTRSQERTRVSGAVAGRVVPDHELTVMGFANVNRSNDLLDPTNGPSIVYRTLKCYEAFIRGWSATATDGISVQDTAAALDKTLPANGSDGKPDWSTRPLFPVTEMAITFDTDVWPVLQNLFSSGTGFRRSVTQNEFVRYQVNLLDAYQRILDVLWVNKLAYHFDWTKVHPFTDTTPLHLYDLAEMFNATDVGIAQAWLPLMKRFNEKICMPGMIEEIKRLKTPMYSVDFNGRIRCPTYTHLYSDFSPNTLGGATYDYVKASLDFLDTGLNAASAVFQSFLPFPLAQFNPWDLPTDPVLDLDRASGWYNSPIANFDAFGDTGDPVNTKAILTETDAGTTEVQAILYTRHPQPTWSEVKMASIFELHRDVTDDTYALLTPHLYKKAYIADDFQSVINYDGTAYDETTVEYRYEDYISSRFRNSSLAFGVLEPGLIGAEIASEPLRRMVRLETNFLFNTRVLKTITVNMAGASLRELRYFIAQAVNESMADPMA